MNKDKLSRALLSLSELVSRLRGPCGCPWDAQQTDATIKMYLLEETYEVLDAIERGSSEDVCQELGDLLFQIIFLARLAEETGKFDLVEVIEKITEKMIKRHPHVFGSTRVNSAEDVAENWVRIKKGEVSVPESLPALLRAHRLGERTSKMTTDSPDVEEIWNMVEEAFEDLRKAILDRDKQRIGEETGDLLFGLVNLARHWGLNAEHLLRIVNKKFLERFKETQKALKS